LYDFLCALEVPTRIEATVEEFRGRGQLSLANEYSQVWNILMEVFDQAVEVMGEETVGLERFTNILNVGLGEYQIGLIPASVDQVLVGSVERSRSHEVKAMYILGCNDGVFPSPGRDEGILSDQDRAVLKGAGFELANDTRTAAFDEQYLVYKALTTASCYLRLSWPIADFEGKSMRPSMIVTRLRRLFTAISEASNILEPEEGKELMELVTGSSPTFKKMVLALGHIRDGKEVSSLWQGVYRWFMQQAEWQEQCQATREAFCYKNLAQPVAQENTAMLYGNPAYSSVSRLEKYAACPFAYYVQYGLGAQERKVYRFEPPEVGTFMHGVIERFSLSVAENNLSWRTLERDWCEKKVSEIVEEILSRMEGSGISGSRRYSALAIRLKRVVTRSVWLIAQHIRRGGFEPVGYEVDFREGGAFTPITIELPTGEKVLLTGRIDRVDALKTEEGTYLRIIDYKSGKKDFKLSDVACGLQLQLITYLDAIWEQGGMGITPPVLPGGMLYFSLDDPIIKGSPETTEEEIEKAIMKELKMKGLLLADVKLIREMDHDINGPSLIIPARMNKGEVLGQSSAATLEQLNLLRSHVRRLLEGICQEIMKGNVPIKPYKKKSMSACKYCSFAAVCQFDTARKENTFRPISDLKDREVWERLGVKGSGAEVDN
jgi:ATP-dependent helicase/nuclease subunit B